MDLEKLCIFTIKKLRDEIKEIEGNGKLYSAESIREYLDLTINDKEFIKQIVLSFKKNNGKK